MTSPRDAGWVIVSAPTNLGLRPPERGSVPGAAKAPEALREAGLFARLAEYDIGEAGVVLPGRYRDDADAAAQRLRNHDAILDHADRLAERLQLVHARGQRPIVLGGDCSILLGAGLAARAWGQPEERGPVGLIHIDGHTDYRHPGNSDQCSSLAGEDLAAVTGRHWASVADHGGPGPYFDPAHTMHLGCRDADENLPEVRQTLALVLTSSEIAEHGVPAALQAMKNAIVDAGTDTWWLHVDIDVLDPGVFSAVDSPDPGGLGADDLVRLVTPLLPRCVGVDFTVYDPDLDPSREQAALLADIIARMFGG
jgi:arginase